MTDLYLIAHKVRGEPTFDVAAKLQIGDEEGWIIHTSGHRAYPYWSIRLDEIEFEGNGNYQLSEELSNLPEDWENLPDHYTVKASPKEAKIAGTSLLASLGFSMTKSHPSIKGELKRRI